MLMSVVNSGRRTRRSQTRVKIVAQNNEKGRRQVYSHQHETRRQHEVTRAQRAISGYIKIFFKKIITKKYFLLIGKQERDNGAVRVVRRAEHGASAAQEGRVGQAAPRLRVRAVRQQAGRASRARRARAQVSINNFEVGNLEYEFPICSTHLYGRRLVLEWASDAQESIETKRRHVAEQQSRLEGLFAVIFKYKS